MPKNNSAIQDTAHSAPDSEDGITSPADGDTDGGLIMGKYKSQDDLVNAMKEMQARSTKAEQELAEARKQEKLNETLANLTDTLSKSGKSEEDEAARREAQFNKLVERIQSGDEKEMVSTFLELQAGLESDVRGELTAREKALLERIDALESKFGDVQMSASEEYRAYKPQIDALIESGEVTSKAAALKIVKALSMTARTDDAPPAPLGTSGVHRHIGTTKVLATEAEIAELRKLMPAGTSEAEIQQAIKEYSDEKRRAS